MNTDRRDILNEVASGRLTAAEAADRLRELDGEDPARRDTRADQPPGQPESAIRELRVRCSLAEVRIVADPTVATAVADGPHEARTDGPVLTITDREEGRGFTFRAGKGHFGIGPRGGRLEIRANPDLGLTVELKAGELEVLGMRGRIGAAVTAGTLRIDRFEGPLDLQVKAGAVEGSGRLTHGASSVQCKLGEVRLDLSPDSNVAVSARTRVGEVRLPDGESTGGIDPGERRYVFGDGQATLDIDTTAGAVEIRRGL